MKLTSSPFFLKSERQLNKQKPPHHASRFLSYSQLAIQENLKKIIPTGGTITVLNPKQILETHLPSAAKEKNAKIICVGGTAAFLQKISQMKLLLHSKHTAADIHITEPDALTPQGGLFSPAEAAIASQFNPIGIASVMQWTKETPAEYDFAPLSKTITELGIYNPEQLEKNLRLLHL